MDSFISCLFATQQYMRASKKWMHGGTKPKKYGEYLASKRRKKRK